MVDSGNRPSPLMPEGVDFRRVFFKSLGLAALCTLFTIPYFKHLLFVSFKARDPVAMPLDFNGVLITQSFILFVVCFLSAMAGFLFSKRLGLPGFGDPGRFGKTAPLLFGTALVMGSLTYLLFDRYFFHISPATYPNDLLYLFAYPYKIAFTNEVVLRFCFVTLAIGILKHKTAGVILVSGIASLLTLKYIQFLDIGRSFSHLFLIQLVISFFVNLILGYLYVTRGLIYSMALHFLFGTRLVLVVWVLG